MARDAFPRGFSRKLRAWIVWESMRADDPQRRLRWFVSVFTRAGGAIQGARAIRQHLRVHAGTGN